MEVLTEDDKVFPHFNISKIKRCRNVLERFFTSDTLHDDAIAGMDAINALHEIEKIMWVNNKPLYRENK